VVGIFLAAGHYKIAHLKVGELGGLAIFAKFGFVGEVDGDGGAVGLAQLKRVAVNGRDFADSPMAFASTAAAWTAITGGRLTLSLILGRGSGIRSLRRAGNSDGQKTKTRQIKM
jgi:hypothetical protein